MKALLRQHHISFRHAFDGILWAFREHPNFRIHAAAASIALAVSYLFGISRLEWIIITFTIVLVFIAEMINTSVEAMTDLITKEWRAEAKIAKDVSAGMTLLAAAGSVIVGFVIFVPYFLGRL